MLTSRAFFIDFDSPLPLNMVLQPRVKDGAFVLDWRLKGLGSMGASQSFYLDDRVSFQEDLTWLLEDSIQVLHLSMNHREIKAILAHPLLKRRAEAFGFNRWPHLVARLWDLLFQPTPLLQSRLLDAAQDLGLSEDMLPVRERKEHPSYSGNIAYLAIHFRAGNESRRLWWDPSRHTLETLRSFLKCAAFAASGLRATLLGIRSAATLAMGSEFSIARGLFGRGVCREMYAFAYGYPAYGSAGAVLTPSAYEYPGFGYGASKDEKDSKSKAAKASKEKGVKGEKKTAVVMLYYWDDRDGSDFSGWWFGPKVGGDQVWAYQPGKDKTPPETGWKVPYDGSVDENFKVVRKKEKKEKKELREEKAAVAYPGMWYGMPTPALLDPHAAERQMQDYARLQQEETKRRLEEEFQRQKQKKEADEKKRLEMETRAKVTLALVAECNCSRWNIFQDLLSELSGLLDMADKGVEQLRETAAPMETSDEQSLHEVEACSEAVEAAGADCKALIKTCMDFLVSHGPEMKDKVLCQLFLAGTSHVEELFAKFDVDRDQMLSTSEVRAFAKELGVEISPEAMKQIWRSMVDEQGGVAFSRFPLLKMKATLRAQLDTKVEVVEREVDAMKQAVVKDLLVPDLRVLSKQMGRLDLRLHRVELLCDRFNSEVERRQQAHLYGARLFAVKVARLYADRRGRSIRQLFREMDANGDGEIDSKEFSLFFMFFLEASAPPELGKAKLPVMPVDFTEDLLAQLFKTVADGGRLSEDVFCRIMRSYGKVVKEGVMTKDLKVTGENAVRKLCVDEVLEVLEGPVEEEELKVRNQFFNSQNMFIVLTVRGATRQSSLHFR
eukprot:g6605.t2